ncbi:hypothetical protein BGW80DRAFT_1457778 [Lactifluus volemus]|nr:hypothetical protein BGW80DRAFT_1457778 [Lactifluus volemus]
MSSSPLSSDSSTNGHQVLTNLQRSRLVKSTRKLTKILGETPILQVKVSSTQPLSPKEYLDNRVAAQIVCATKKIAHTILQIAHRQEVDNDSDSMRTSPSGLIAPDIPFNVPKSGRSWSPSLLYEESPWSPCEETRSLEAEAGHGDTNASSRVSNANPSSKQQSSFISVSTSSKSLHPPTEWENWREGFEVRSRRRRLSKLSRHLGESIPPNLILPTRASQDDYVPPGVLASNAEPRHRHKRHVSPFRFRPLYRHNLLSPTRPRSSSRRDKFLRPDPLPVISPSLTILSPKGIDAHPANTVQTGNPALMKDSSWVADFALDLPSLRRRNTAPSKRDAVFRRSERRQGWSGEWNAASMQDVIQNCEISDEQDSGLGFTAV